MDIFEIPLQPQQQTISVDLPGGTYRLRFFIVNVEEGGWCMDIGDENGAPMACGIPLVTGADLLEPFRYLGFGGGMFVRSDGVPDQVPAFQNLGVGSHVYFVPDA